MDKSSEKHDDGCQLDVEAILAGSFLMQMIRDGRCSRDILNIPVRLTGFSPSLREAA